MAVAAKDGSMHHSAGRANLHDSMSAGAAKSAHAPVAPMKKPGGLQGKNEGSGKTPIPTDHPHMAGPHQTPTDGSIEDHVAEHGPATHVHHMHDEASGTHHVTSHHGGMGQNMHHSEHESHEDAHDHMGKAMEIHSTEESEANETPDEEAAEEAIGKNESKIPGLV